MRPDAKSPMVFRGLTMDVSREASLELELRHAQKLEAVGRLAAGVAHEINTPIQFVGDSLHFVRDAARDLLSVVDASRTLAEAAASGEGLAAAAASFAEANETADVDYLRDNLPKALERSLEGLSRVTTIVRSMKEFAHPDQTEKVTVDLNQGIESTLTIARNEYKYVADVITEYGAIPRVACHPGEINQVLLNLIVNAAHAIGDRVAGTGDRGTITVTTRRVDDCIEILVADTGTGIPEAVRDRIFDPFFTTKQVGRGTGQGLAIARSIIVDKHSGSLGFESETGRGTTFVVRLPCPSVRMSVPSLEAA
jgi:signal transduction histidine kinase